MKRRLLLAPPHSMGAFTVPEFLAVMAVLAVALLLFLPALERPHRHHPNTDCRNNLRQVYVSFKTWSLDYGERLPAQVSVTNGGVMELVGRGAVFPHFQVMSNELSTPRILACPADARRHFATNFSTDFSDAKISYFVNVDAMLTNDAALLVGDRNLTNHPPLGARLLSLSNLDRLGWDRELHSGRGSLAFADGSVLFTTNGLIRRALHDRNPPPVRLALP